MGVDISKRYSSHSYKPVATKLHDTYPGDGEILAINYLILPISKHFVAFDFFLNTGLD